MPAASATVWRTRLYRFFGASLLHNSTVMTEGSSTHTRSGIEADFFFFSCCLTMLRDTATFLHLEASVSQAYTAPLRPSRLKLAS